MTKYVILFKADIEDLTGEASGDWVKVAGVEAASADAAIRHAAAREQTRGEYVAVPERSFQPKTVTFEQTTAVKLA